MICVRKRTNKCQKENPQEHHQKMKSENNQNLPKTLRSAETLPWGEVGNSVDLTLHVYETFPWVTPLTVSFDVCFPCVSSAAVLIPILTSSSC